jgi:hypothetical protein
MAFVAILGLAGISLQNAQAASNNIPMSNLSLTNERGTVVAAQGFDHHGHHDCHHGHHGFHHGCHHGHHG